MSETVKKIQGQNKELIVFQHEEIWSQGRYDDLMDKVYAEDFTYLHICNQVVQGKQAMETFIKAHRLAFPDWKESPIRMVADGAQVMSHYQASGTHEGEFMGISATGRKISIDGFCISRVWGGKIVEQKAMPNILKLRVQITGEKLAF